IPALDNKEVNPQAIRSAKQAVATQAVATQAVATQAVATQAVAAKTVADVNTAGVVATPQQVAVVAADQGLPELNIPMLKKVLEQNNSNGDTEALELKVVSGRARAEVITDPRFAGLLNKPTIVDSLRQRQGADEAMMAKTEQVVSFGKGTNAVNIPELTLDVSAPMLTVAADAGKAEGVLPFQSQVLNGAEVVAEPATFSAQIDTKPGLAHNAEPVMVLRDGSTMPESKVVQQTIDHLTLHARGDSSSVTVKLHPEELGELQLRVVMEGDQLKVHLQAQSQQVQEVLERHFPRLRNALQEQGVTVEDFQVDVDSGERNEQQFSQQRESSAKLNVDPFSTIDDAATDGMDVEAPVTTAMGGGRSLSVRV
ncbi:MAG: flagellar hook-length control protein FliK, partial [Thermodesulfobacteriota bacterium]|nr:flagellar hook-length control protein FliK [Thermodesulfobacteriota bacterium]